MTLKQFQKNIDKIFGTWTKYSEQSKLLEKNWTGLETFDIVLLCTFCQNFISGKETEF